MTDIHKPDFDGFKAFMKRADITVALSLLYGFGLGYHAIHGSYTPGFNEAVSDYAQSFGFGLMMVAHMYVTAVWANKAHKLFRDTSGGKAPRNWKDWQLFERLRIKARTPNQQEALKELKESLEDDDEVWRDHL